MNTPPPPPPQSARASALARWSQPSAEPFKGALLDRTALADWRAEHGDEPPPPSCMCAQGQVLHYEGGISFDDLAALDQKEADTATMRLLGISRRHAILLRCINDSKPGAPASVISNPAKHLGENWKKVLAFWSHLDTGTYAEWRAKFDTFWKGKGLTWVADAAAAAADAAADAADAAAADADAAAAAAAADAAYYRWRVTALATLELIGENVLKSKGKVPFFLPAFGFSSGDDMMAKLAA